MMLSLLAQILMFQPTNALGVQANSSCDSEGLAASLKYSQCIAKCMVQGQAVDGDACAKKKKDFECQDEDCKSCGFAECMDSEELEKYQEGIEKTKKKYKDTCKDDKKEYLLCHAAPVARVGLLALLALW